MTREYKFLSEQICTIIVRIVRPWKFVVDVHFVRGKILLDINAWKWALINIWYSEQENLNWNWWRKEIIAKLKLKYACDIELEMCLSLNNTNLTKIMSHRRSNFRVKETLQDSVSWWLAGWGKQCDLQPADKSPVKFVIRVECLLGQLRQVA